MKRKRILLLLVTVVVALVLTYFLFPHQPVQAPEVPINTEDQSTPDPTLVEEVNNEESETDNVSEIVITGTFLSLQEVQTEWRTSYMTMLVDDGTEIIRIDLRPIVNNDVRDIPQKLGVERGERIEVRGVLNDEGDFRATAVDSLSPNVQTEAILNE